MPAWQPEKRVPSRFQHKMATPQRGMVIDSYQFESLSGRTGWIFAHFSSISPRFP
jgi:hypothetical protein